MKIVFTKLFHILAIFSFLICGLLFISAEELVILLFTEKWKDMIPFFQILIVGGFSKQIFSLIYNVLLSSGMAKEYLKINIINKFLLLLALPLIYFFGLETYLLVFISIQFSNLFIGIYFVQKTIDVAKFFIHHLFRYGSLYLVSLVIFSFFKIDNFHLFQNLLLNCLLYFAIFITLFFLFAKKGIYIIYEQRKIIR